jgi:hypothetical protein
MNPPVMAPTEPVDDGYIIVFLHNGIAEHSVLSPLLHSLQYLGSRLEVHIRHPQGDDIFTRTLVPLHAMCSPSFYDFIEIIFHIFGIYFSPLVRGS